ncbi:hypothetical protein CROQUDRAFT_49017 [Cronartium quercuum f. sp. fusiforme G11]|uniref:Glycan binding protein Y3-like domain-containing protein n=1 Tax=Cronartium quercuum f. sp. fusiforme G11 TaxID=708437 RepID=A0A9P6T987_9BASI|nr:hypothetical protein CROQUDRAFT_49017 [Cronartium quercuum f. sp. fusiforme G11]
MSFNIRNLVILSFALFAYVYGKCRTSGATYGTPANRARASQALQSVCAELAGTYGASETKSTCRDSPENVRFNFVLQHVKNGQRVIDANECMDGMNKEITGCNQGGDTTYTNWRYSVDPNTGLCQ